MAALANKKHEAVALAYLGDPEKIGWRAYAKIYPNSSENAAKTAFSRLLKNADFATRVAETHEAAAQGAVMAANEVLEELSKLGRANMKDYVRFTSDGDPIIDFSGTTRDQAAAITQVSVEDFTEGRGKDAREVRRVTFRLADKRGALDLLGKHHKLFVERVEHSFSGVADRLAAALARTEGNGDGKVKPDRHAPRAGHARKAARKGKRARA